MEGGTSARSLTGTTVGGGAAVGLGIEESASSEGGSVLAGSGLSMAINVIGVTACEEANSVGVAMRTETNGLEFELICPDETWLLSLGKAFT